jgi:hypothetical protein
LVAEDETGSNRIPRLTLVDDLDSFVSGLGSGDGGLFIALPAP